MRNLLLVALKQNNNKRQTPIILFVLNNHFDKTNQHKFTLPDAVPFGPMGTDTQQFAHTVVQ
jgi:hypothetical protein